MDWEYKTLTLWRQFAHDHSWLRRPGWQWSPLVRIMMIIMITFKQIVQMLSSSSVTTLGWEGQAGSGHRWWELWWLSWLLSNKLSKCYHHHQWPLLAEKARLAVVTAGGGHHHHHDYLQTNFSNVLMVIINIKMMITCMVCCGGWDKCYHHHDHHLHHDDHLQDHHDDDHLHDVLWWVGRGRKRRPDKPQEVASLVCTTII